MTTVAQDAIVVWSAPDWADDRLVDDGMVEHTLSIGEVPTYGDEPPVGVMVIQRDEVDLAANPVSFTRMPPEVRLAGVRMSETQVRQLATLLTAGADLIAQVGAAPAAQAETAGDAAESQTRSKLAR